MRIVLMDIFNKTLGEIPSIAQDLEKKVTERNWDEKRAEHAVRIIRWLKDAEPAVKRREDSRYYVSFPYMHLTITWAEIGCECEKFDEESVLKVDRYVRGLLQDINRMSNDISFSLETTTPYNTYCDIGIRCEF